MKTRTNFPHQIAIRDPEFIPLSDGTRLAVRIWLPVDAEERPVPAILEYLPYRRKDGTADRDASTHPYFAGHGYASVRVDMRGSGDSEGVLLGEGVLVGEGSPEAQAGGESALLCVFMVQASAGETGGISPSQVPFEGSNMIIP